MTATTKEGKKHKTDSTQLVSATGKKLIVSKIRSAKSSKRSLKRASVQGKLGGKDGSTTKKKD